MAGADASGRGEGLIQPTPDSPPHFPFFFTLLIFPRYQGVELGRKKDTNVHGGEWRVMFANLTCQAFYQPPFQNRLARRITNSRRAARRHHLTTI